MQGSWLTCSQMSNASTAWMTIPPLCAPTGAGTLTGCVISTADGDAISVLDAACAQHKVRLSGIDAVAVDSTQLE